jgi:hypothetical protein
LFGSTRVLIQVEVPISVNVNVDSGEQCGLQGANISVPVDVDVDVAIEISGKPIGTGKGGVTFDKCQTSVAHLWRQCGGIAYDGMGSSPQKFVSSCQEGICVQKNEWFAMCMPEDRRQVFKHQGWSGKFLKCRRG